MQIINVYIDDKHVQNIKKKIIRIHDINDCINVLLKNRSSICLMALKRAMKVMEKYREARIMNVAKPVFKHNRMHGY